ncbi:hypothetical protein FNF31_07899 [Cafeteria roenbergensis]|uniref:DUF4455 domain-containing protein n=1 Tax=Cafeteria roenbergensis TaxID=33653 RepID=A0A5A8C086_CAFRO|nr:hypothetical protein FNF31_07899 [Cafeteria roenbergensis]
MASLRKPRKSFKNLERDYGAQAEVRAPDGHVIRPSDFALLRADPASEARRAAAAAADEVKSLGHRHDLPAPASQKGGAGIRSMQARRKADHDAAVAAWLVKQREFYDQAEDDVLEAGRALRQQLAELDDEVETRLAALEDPTQAIAMCRQDVTACWAAVEGLEERRVARAEDFKAFLTELENRRCEELGAELRALTSRLSSVGHAQPGAVERIVAKEAADVNALALKNRTDAADVGAKLLATAALSRAANLRRWEAAQQAWRVLRHDDAMERVRERLNSPEFVDPPARVQAAARLREAQGRVHEQVLLPALRRLAALRPPQLTEEAVADARAQLEAAADAEAAAAADGFRGIQAAQAAASQAADEARDALRLELHGFAALAPASGLREVAEAINDEVLSAPENEALWRRGGGLQREVALLASRAASDEVVFAMHLQAAAERAELLVASLTLGDVLAEQGKAADREALATTADKMRTARRTELPGLVARLQTQTARLASATGLEPVVSAELAACAEALAELCEACYEALVANRLEVPAALRAVATGEGLAAGAGGEGAGDGSSAAGGGAAGGAATARHRSGSTGASVAHRSVGRRGGRAASVGRRSQASGAGKSAKSGRSRRSRASGGAGAGSIADDARSTVIGQTLPMAELRALQRRVGMLVVACELPIDAQAVLRDALQALRKQAVANTAVDAAIAEGLLPVIRRREAEGAALLDRIAAFLERQSRALDAASVNLCRFWSRLARADIRHATRETAVDDGAADDLNEALDAFEEAHAAREADFERLAKLCRQSPDEDALAERFANVQAALTAVEEGYRAYHEQVTTRSREHPVAVGANVRRHRRALCQLFGLRFPDADRIDGVPRNGAREAAAADASAEEKEADEGGEHAEGDPAAGATRSGAGAGAGDGPSGTAGQDTAAAAGAAAGGAGPPAGGPPGLTPLGAELLELVALDPQDGVSPRSVRPGARDEAALLMEEEGPTPSCTLEEAEVRGWKLVAVPAGDAGAAAGERSSEEGKGADDDGAAGAGSGAGAGGAQGATYAEEVPVADLAAALVVTRRETEAEMQARRRAEEEEAGGAAARRAKEEEEEAAAAAAAAEAEAAAASKAGGKGAKGGKTPAKPAKGKAGGAKGPKGGKKGAAAAEEEAEAKQWPRPADEEEELEWEARARAGMEREDEEAAARRDHEAATAVYSAGVEDDRGVPLSPGGEPMALYCEANADVAAGWVADIRQALLGAFQRQAQARRVQAAELCEDRVSLFTAELTERVRLHWPRQARAETELRAPREAELLAHAQRLERHCRAWREKADRQAKAFDGEAEAARQHTAAFVARLAELQSSLPAQASLAALQGQQSRAKAMLVAYETEAEGWRARLAGYAAAEPRRLTALNREFMRTCTRFAEGGEYDDAEVRDVAAALAQAEKELAADVARRRADAEAVTAAQREAKEGLAAFEQAFADSLRALSMREGLGKRFGAPRRQCTERLRTLLGWSDEEERRIVARLDELEALTEEGSAAGRTLREREVAAFQEAEARRRAGGPDASHEVTNEAMAAAQAAAEAAEAAAARGEGVSAMLAEATTAPPRAGFAAGEDEEEDEATVRLMARGATLQAARGRATAFVRRMRKQARAAAGEGDGDSTEDEDEDDAEDGDDGGGGDEEEAEGAAAGDDGAVAAGAGARSGPRLEAPPKALDALALRDPAAPLFAGGSSAAAGAAPSLSARLRFCMLCIHEALLRRARVLEALKEETRPFDDCADLTLSDEPPRGGGRSKAADAEAEAEAAAAAAAAAAPKGAKAGKSTGKGKGKADAAAAAAAAKAAEEEAAAADAADAAASPPLRAQVQEALAACREATRRLFDEEGEPLAEGEAGLPQSLRDYLEREELRCESARVDACRRLRDLVQRLWRVMAEAPAAAVADVASRAARYSDDAAGWARRRFRSAARALVDVRKAHTARLVPSLADPNKAAELEELDREERRRCEEHAAMVATGRARELLARRIGGELLRRRAVHCAAWCLRVSDAMLIAEDLAALPGDEEEAPTKLGLRRLRKQLRRDKAESAAAAEEAARLAAAAEEEAAATGKGAKAKPAAKGGKKGAAGAAAEEDAAREAAEKAAKAAAAERALAEAGAMLPPEGPGTAVDGAGVPTRAYKRRRWAVLSPRPESLLALPASQEWGSAAQAEAEERARVLLPAGAAAGEAAVSRYSECSRHVMRTRDAAWRAFGEGCRAVSGTTDRWYTGLFESVVRWEAHWASLAASLRAEANKAQGLDEPDETA